MEWWSQILLQLAVFVPLTILSFQWLYERQDTACLLYYSTPKFCFDAPHKAFKCELEWVMFLVIGLALRKTQFKVSNIEFIWQRFQEKNIWGGRMWERFLKEANKQRVIEQILIAMDDGIYGWWILGKCETIFRVLLSWNKMRETRN